MFIVATLVHAALFMGMYVLLGLKEFPSPWAAVLSQAIGNAVVGIVAFAIIESLPGAMERRRFRRSTSLIDVAGLQVSESMAIQEDRRRITVRLTVLQVACVVVFAALGISFWLLQIVEHAKYQEMAENNHQRTLALRAPRGVLTTATARCSSRTAIPSRFRSSASTPRTSTARSGCCRRLPASTPSDVRAIVARHAANRATGRLSSSRTHRWRRWRRSRRGGSTSNCRTSWSRRCRRASIPPKAWRRICSGTSVRSTTRMVAADDTLKSGDLVGQAGIEKTYNPLLMGQDGAKVVVVNSLGREIRTLEEVPPTEGKRLQLTIDYDLQKAVEDAFAASRSARLTNAGAAVVLDPNTGEVLAFTSQPAYDPNAFAAGIDRATWASLNTDEPASAERPRGAGTLLAGIDVQDGGGAGGARGGRHHARLPRELRAAAQTSTAASSSAGRKAGHGSIDMRHAIEQSCDVYFYTVGNMLGVDKINKWATLLGLGVKSGIDLPNEVAGLVPSTQWKQETMHEKWYAGETISVAIGQGAVSVTPVSMAVYMATLANGGTRVTPHLLKAVDEGNGLEAGAGARRRSRRSTSIPRSCRRFAMACGWSSTPAAPAAGRAFEVRTCRARRVRRRSSRTPGAWRPRAVRKGPSRQRLVRRSSRRATSRRSPASCSSSTACTAPNAAAVAHHILDTFFAKQDGRPLPPRRRWSRCGFDFSDPLRARAPARRCSGRVG